MKAQLIIRYDFSRDDDDFGWLHAELITLKVSGKAGFWVQWQDIEDWASELADLPMRGGAESQADWGQTESDGSNYQPVIKTVVKVGGTGTLEVIVSLGDYLDPRVHCQSVFETDFPALHNFADELDRLMRREATEAVLVGLDGS